MPRRVKYEEQGGQLVAVNGVPFHTDAPADIAALVGVTSARKTASRLHGVVRQKRPPKRKTSALEKERRAIVEGIFERRAEEDERQAKQDTAQVLGSLATGVRAGAPGAVAAFNEAAEQLKDRLTPKQYGELMTAAAQLKSAAEIAADTGSTSVELRDAAKETRDAVKALDTTVAATSGQTQADLNAGLAAVRAAVQANDPARIEAAVTALQQEVTRTGAATVAGLGEVRQEVADSGAVTATAVDEVRQAVEGTPAPSGAGAFTTDVRDPVPKYTRAAQAAFATAIKTPGGPAAWRAGWTPRVQAAIVKRDPNTSEAEMQAMSPEEARVVVAVLEPMAGKDKPSKTRLAWLRQAEKILAGPSDSGVAGDAGDPVQAGSGALVHAARTRGVQPSPIDAFRAAIAADDLQRAEEILVRAIEDGSIEGEMATALADLLVSLR